MTVIEKRPDLILMDISMPGLNGLDVCSRIRDDIDCHTILKIQKRKLQGELISWLIF